MLGQLSDLGALLLLGGGRGGEQAIRLRQGPALRLHLGLVRLRAGPLLLGLQLERRNPLERALERRQRLTSCSHCAFRVLSLIGRGLLPRGGLRSAHHADTATLLYSFPNRFSNTGMAAKSRSSSGSHLAS